MSDCSGEGAIRSTPCPVVADWRSALFVLRGAACVAQHELSLFLQLIQQLFAEALYVASEHTSGA